MPKFNIPLKLFSLNPPAQKVYITHNKAMVIANLVDISVRRSIITHKSYVYVYQFNKGLRVIIDIWEISGKLQPSPLCGRFITIEIWLNPTSIYNAEKFEC